MQQLPKHEENGEEWSLVFLLSIVIIMAGAAASIAIVACTALKVREENRCKAESVSDSEEAFPKPPSTTKDNSVEEAASVILKPQRPKWMCGQGHIVEEPITVMFYSDHLIAGKEVKGPEKVLVCPVCHSKELTELKATAEEGARLRDLQLVSLCFCRCNR